MTAPQNLSFAVLGTGALGGFYGGLLARSGHEVHFLVRSDYDYIKQHGLQVDTPLGDFHLNTVNVYSRPEEMPPVDCVLVCWKSTVELASPQTLAQALNQLCRQGNSFALVLQNGLDVESTAANILGAKRVMGGCCFLCSNKIGPGHIQHLDYGRIAFGEYSMDFRGQVTERMKTVSSAFESAQIPNTPAQDLRTARWKKLVWNIPFNGLSVALQADTRQLLNDPHTTYLVEALMGEVQHAASMCGIHVEDEHVQRMLTDTRAMVPYDSSMLLDFRAGRPIEVEAIFGNPLRAALAAGFTPTRIEMLYQQLCFLDRQNLSS